MPIPKPRKNEDKDGFVNRCMADDVMNSEFPDSSQRAAVCNNQWKEKSAMANKNTYSLEVEVFAIGKWNGLDFEKEDLQSIVNAFHSLGDNHQVPLKMGHNDEQPFTDGQPALGWVVDISLTSDGKLMAHFEDMPKIVYEAMEAKLYRNVSIELDMGVEHKGNYYPWVLSGVALLGADIPAVNTLADLQAYMGRDNLSFKKRVVFSTTHGKHFSKRKTSMSDGDKTWEERFAALEARVKAQDTIIERLTEENTELKADKAKMSAEKKAFEAEEVARKNKEQRKNLETRLEVMVKEKQIAPFTRDEFLRDYDDAGEDKNAVLFAIDKLEKTIESNPQYFGREQARLKHEREKTEDGKRPDQIVATRTREYMNKHGEKNFSIAKRAVLQADAELAEAYKMGGM